MAEREQYPGGEGADEEAVAEVEEASEPLTPEEVREAQAEAAASGEAVVEVEEASEELTPEEIRQAQAEDQAD
jgi:lipoate-protein ligase A